MRVPDNLRSSYLKHDYSIVTNLTDIADTKTNPTRSRHSTAPPAAMPEESESTDISHSSHTSDRYNTRDHGDEEDDRFKPVERKKRGSKSQKQHPHASKTISFSTRQRVYPEQFREGRGRSRERGRGGTEVHIICAPTREGRGMNLSWVLFPPDTSTIA